MLHTIAIPGQVGEDFALSFPETTSSDGAARVVAITDAHLFSLSLHDGSLLAKRALQYAQGATHTTNDRIIVAQSFKKAARVLHVDTLEDIATLAAHRKTMTCTPAVGPYGRYAATGAEGGEVLLHDLDAQEARRFVFPKWPNQRANPGIDRLVFSADGRHLIAHAAELHGQVRVLSVPDLTEVFVSRTDGDDEHALRTTPHLSLDRSELVLEYSYFASDGDWDAFEMVPIGEAEARAWSGRWGMRENHHPRTLGPRWHLTWHPLTSHDASAPPYRAIYTGISVDQVFTWGPYEGFLAGRTFRYWDSRQPLPDAFDQASEGEAFLEVFCWPDADAAAVVDLLDGVAELIPGTYPWYGEGKLAHAKLPRELATSLAAQLDTLDDVHTFVI